jgi:hypothetical protein
MPRRLEGDALLADAHGVALVSDPGSIAWLGAPRCDPGVSCAALLGGVHGRWQLAPSEEVRATRRRYRDESLVLETDFETAAGSIRLVEFVPPRLRAAALVRLVEGVRGRVRMRMDLRARSDGGSVDGVQAAVAGSDGVRLRTPVETHREGVAVRADFVVTAGELLPFVLEWAPSHHDAPAPLDPLRALADTEAYWAERAVSRAATQHGPGPRRRDTRSAGDG